MTTPTPSDAAALIAAIERLSGQAILDRGATSQAMTTPVVAAVPAGLKLESLKRFADDYRDHPERRAGTASFHDAASFIAHVNRFKSEHTVVFANPDPAAPMLTAVLDYHDQGAAGTPRFLRHRATYKPALDEAWRVWSKTEAAGAMQQAAFAEFLEDRLDDLSAPPDPSEALANKLREAGGTFASVAGMLDLAKGLHMTEASEVKEILNPNTGEAKVVYVSEHRDAAGEPLRIPNLLCIAIPVFYLGALYRVAVRLRYRRAGSRVVWLLQPYRLDKVFEHAFDELLDKVRAETELPVWRGAPEA